MLNKLLKNFRFSSSLKKFSATNSHFNSISTRSNLIYMNKYHFNTKNEKVEETQEQLQEEEPKIQINCKCY